MIPGPPQIAFRLAIGEAIEEYSQVEYHLMVILGNILDITPRTSATLFKAAQNVRARGIMFDELLEAKSGGNLNPHWNNCNAFLHKLSEYRNAIAHWTFGVIVFKNKDAISTHPGLTPVGGGMKPILKSGIQDFVEDCGYARAFLNELNNLISGWPVTSPEISQLQPIRRNLAVLEPNQIAKAPQRQRPPSKPSRLRKVREPSSAERRKRALSALAKKK